MGGRKADCISTLKLPTITQSDKVSPSMQRENKIKMSALKMYSYMEGPQFRTELSTLYCALL